MKPLAAARGEQRGAGGDENELEGLWASRISPRVGPPGWSPAGGRFSRMSSARARMISTPIVIAASATLKIRNGRNVAEVEVGKIDHVAQRAPGPGCCRARRRGSSPARRCRRACLAQHPHEHRQRDRQVTATSSQRISVERPVSRPSETPRLWAGGGRRTAAGDLSPSRRSRAGRSQRLDRLSAR